VLIIRYEKKIKKGLGAGILGVFGIAGNSENIYPRLAGYAVVNMVCLVHIFRTKKTIRFKSINHLDIDNLKKEAA